MANDFNAHPHPQPKEAVAHAAAAKGSVWVSQTAAGPPVTQVKQSTFTANHLYWLNFAGGKQHHNLDFTVTFKPGSPLTKQVQHFHFPSGYGGGTTTPFGVPFWGGDPILGPAVLSVQADGVAAGSFHFTVVA